jgi:hypothetical protein
MKIFPISPAMAAALTIDALFAHWLRKCDRWRGDRKKALLSKANEPSNQVRHKAS